MNISEISTLLDTLSTGMSDYEFENFFLESFPTSSRQLVSAMKRIEELHFQIEILRNSIDNAKNDLEDLRNALDRRKLFEMQKQYDQLVFWYQSIDPEIRKKLVDSYEEQEPEYWANYLGRQAAIELLTIGRTTKETMDKMSNLPVDAFEESVRVCTRYAQLIKDTTASVEESLGINVNNLPGVDNA